MSPALENKPAIRGALVLVSASLILWEILLTRIYSVMLYYHYAFLAVSVAMFGLTVGTLVVFFCPSLFPLETTRRQLRDLALMTGALMIVAMIIELMPPPQLKGNAGLAMILFRTYVLSALPFIPGGAFVCLALTRYQRVGLMYAADLLGAGVGCFVFPLLLQGSSGPGAVFVLAAACITAAAVLTQEPGRVRWRVGLIALCLTLIGAAVLNTQNQWLRVRWRHDGLLPKPMHENWNAFSRIMVLHGVFRPFMWGADPALLNEWPPMEQLMLQIDSGAGTPIYPFSGDLQPLKFLKYDLTAFVHYIRPTGRVLVIGPGGGRDILTALVFGHTRVDAVEVNGNILQALNGVFGDFSGHLDRDPRVRFYVDEGRSYLERTSDQYDVIQCSLVDTVAATAAGAYAFVENGLYTQEAWALFLSRLRPGGVLTFSRWYFGSSEEPVEVYRTLTLAAAALRSLGIQDPEKHIVLVRSAQVRENQEGLATVLVSPTPFSSKDVRTAIDACRTIHCEVAYAADVSVDPFFRVIVADPLGTEVQQYAFDITAPTDNRPYFFFHARLKDVVRALYSSYGNSFFNYSAISILAILLGLSAFLAILFVVLPPLWLIYQGRWNVGQQRQMWVFPLYFALIGLAFMFVEMGLMQRLGLYLGHPTYGFTVTMFGLLLFAGVGSWGIDQARWLERSVVRNAIPFGLAALIIGVDQVSRLILARSLGHTIEARMAVALLLISLPAVAMGCCFPLAMQRIANQETHRTPWYWAINGAFSILGSVLAMVVSFSAGLSATLLTGAGMYVAAGLLLAGPGRPEDPDITRADGSEADRRV